MFPARVFWQRPTSASALADSDVRDGTVNGATTGTLAVPDPKYVRRGIATDDTVGTMPKSEGE